MKNRKTQPGTSKFQFLQWETTHLTTFDPSSTRKEKKTAIMGSTLQKSRVGGPNAPGNLRKLC